MKCTKPGPPVKPGRQQLSSDFFLRLKKYEECSSQIQDNIKDYSEQQEFIQKELDNLKIHNEHLKKHKTLLITPDRICYPTCCRPTTELYSEEKMRLVKQKEIVEDNLLNANLEIGILEKQNQTLKNQIKSTEVEICSISDCIQKIGKCIKNPTDEFELKQLERELEQAKKKFLEAEKALGEMRNCVQVVQLQLEEYNAKCDEAGKILKEEICKVDTLKTNFEEVKRDINGRTATIKTDLEQKLIELGPLPDALKTAQITLKNENECYNELIEENEKLTDDLKKYENEIIRIENEINKFDAKQDKVTNNTKDLQEKYDNLINEIEHRKEDFSSIKEKVDEQLNEIDNKEHEVSILTHQLKETQEECRRNVERTKENCEYNRKVMEEQIQSMEGELKYSRMSELSAEDEREEVSNRMQRQVNNLRHNVLEATSRMKTLQKQLQCFEDIQGKPSPLAPVRSDISLPCECNLIQMADALTAAKEQWK